MMATNLRYYYSFLNMAERKLFDSIYMQLAKQQTMIHALGTARAMKKVLLYVLKDCPEFFYVDHSRMQILSGVGYVNAQMVYTKNHAEIHAISRKLEEIGNCFLAQVKKRNMNNREVVRYVHDFILKNTEYAQENLMMGNASGDVGTICGVFLNQRAVCGGISLAAKWLLDQAGIPSGVIDGRMIDADSPRLSEYTGGPQQDNHAWNIVNVNDHWSYMDITMDLGASQEQKKWISYDYFLRNDANMEKYVQYVNPYVESGAEHDSFFACKKRIFATEAIFQRYLQYCAQNKVRRLYFQLEGAMRRKSPEMVQKQVSQYITSGYRYRWNQRLSIYDFKLA